jgi:hypothetical protein
MLPNKGYGLAVAEWVGAVFSNSYYLPTCRRVDIFGRRLFDPAEPSRRPKKLGRQVKKVAAVLKTNECK